MDAGHRRAGHGGQVLHYTISAGKPIVVDGGARNDKLVIDVTIAGTIRYQGGQGDDSLTVLGQSAAAATYTPGTNNRDGIDGHPDLRGTVVVGASAISFQELEAAGAVLLQDVATVTVQSPGGKDALTLGKDKVQGTVAGVVPIVPLLVKNVTKLVVGTGANNQRAADTVTLADTMDAVGLQALTVRGGDGNDTFRVQTANLTLPAGGAIRFEGGGGFDILAGPGVAATYDVTGLNRGTVSAGAGALTFIDIEHLAGGPAHDIFRFQAGGWLTGLIHSGSGPDTVDVSPWCQWFRSIWTAFWREFR